MTHVTEHVDSSCHCLQVEGLRNEYNRVTSGDKPKTGTGAASDTSSQLKQQAQSLQASTQSFALYSALHELCEATSEVNLAAHLVAPLNSVCKLL